MVTSNTLIPSVLTATRVVVQVHGDVQIPVSYVETAENQILLFFFLKDYPQIPNSCRLSWTDNLMVTCQMLCILPDRYFYFYLMLQVGAQAIRTFTQGHLDCK